MCGRIDERHRASAALAAAFARRDPEGSVSAIGTKRPFPLHPSLDGHKHLFCKEKSLAERFAGDQPGETERSKPV